MNVCSFLLPMSITKKLIVPNDTVGIKSYLPSGSDVAQLKLNSSGNVSMARAMLSAIEKLVIYGIK